jgi:undecaprenyl-diphosphatase
MEIYKALLLGILQGIVEWLPISSEGITSLVMITFFGDPLKEAVFLAIWLHIGTLVAVIIFFRRDIRDISSNLLAFIKGSKQSQSISKLTCFLVISTFFTALIGTPILLLSINQLNLPGNIATLGIGSLLIITGFIQLIVRRKSDSFKRLRLMDAIPLGIIQGFSVLPGISRSGITVSTLLFLHYEAKETLRLSYLLSIPVIIGAEIGLILLNQVVWDLSIIFAMGASFITGIITIRLFITLSQKIRFGYFCIIFGLISYLVLII